MNPKEIVICLIENDSNITSIAELERKLDIANGTLSRWDKSTPTTKVLEKISDYFNVSIDYLLGREKTDEEKSRDLDKMLDNAMSFNGKPMTENDREVIRAYLEGKFENK